MADGGLPPTGGGAGVAGIITAVGGLFTTICVGVAYVMERRAKARAAPPLTAESIAEIARAVVLADREPGKAAAPRRRPAKKSAKKPAKKGRRT